MSHPHSFRVSPNSPAARALSDAADARQHPDRAAAPDASATPEAASPGPATQPQGELQGRRWPTALTQVPEPVKRLAGQTADRWRQLSTTQKVVGGALVAAGGWYLLSRSGQSAKTSRPRKSSDQATDTLHELLLFVNDRIEGYKRAVDESTDTELRGYYKQLVSQSQQFANALNAHLREQGHGREEGTTLKGKLYRAWMDAKAAVTNRDEKAILGSNVYGEEWALKAYEEALSDQSLPAALRREVQRQYALSQKTYERLKKLEGKQ